jgi:hypothetical protein
MEQPYGIVKQKNSVPFQVRSGNSDKKRGDTYASLYFVKLDVSI